MALQKVFVLDKAYTLGSPCGWAFDMMAEHGIDYLQPKYLDVVAELDDKGEIVIDLSTKQPVAKHVYSPIPPDMPLSRVVAISLAAMLTEAEGLDGTGHANKVWTP